MKRLTPSIQLILAALLCAVCAACAPAAAHSSVVRQSGSGVQLPTDFPAGFVQYARVDRIDKTIREVFVSAAAVDAIQGWQPLPNGTMIVIVGYYAQRGEDGEPLRDAEGLWIPGESAAPIHVAEKRDDWTAADFAAEGVRNGAWNFGSFDAASLRRTDEDLVQCFNCHSTTGGTDFIWTHGELAQFVRDSSALQYRYCDLSGRSPC